MNSSKMINSKSLFSCSVNFRHTVPFYASSSAQMGIEFIVYWNYFQKYTADINVTFCDFALGTFCCLMTPEVIILMFLTLIDSLDLY